MEIQLYEIIKTMAKSVHQLHMEAMVVDTHCDTPLRIDEEHADLGKRSDEGHNDFIRMKEGGYLPQILLDNFFPVASVSFTCVKLIPITSQLHPHRASSPDSPSKQLLPLQYSVL